MSAGTRQGPKSKCWHEEGAGSPGDCIACAAGTFSEVEGAQSSEARKFDSSSCHRH